MTIAFRALVVRKSADRKTFTRAIEERRLEDLPKGDVLIRVRYSSLNYKDGLSCLGNPGVTRRYPHTPGIDAAGIVESSSSSACKPGDPIVIVSQDLGMNTDGGFGQYIRVPADWVMPLPEGMSLRESMVYGTAGFTAALAVRTLWEQGLRPERGPVVVSGATGGVGSLSVALLAGRGFSVAAATGKKDAHDFLMGLGASEVIARDALLDDSGRPLLKETWAGGVDTVGGATLATILRSCKEGGAVAATGNVSSPALPVTVFPFILRGVRLLGINAQGTAMELRREIWSRLAREWRPANLESLVTERDLDHLDAEIDRILSGAQCGRVVVDMGS